MYRLLTISCLSLGLLACTDPDADPAPAERLACGAATVATVTTALGTTVELCVHPDGTEVVAEARPSGAVATVAALDLGTIDRCALDAYLALTEPTAPVPAALVASCARRSARDRTAALAGRKIVDDVVLAQPPVAPVAAAYSVGFCASTTGTSNFVTHVCKEHKCPSGVDCSNWCAATLKALSQRTMSGVLGDEGNMARQEIASCGGTTRFRGFTRWDVGDAFATFHDATVPAGWTYWIEMHYIGGLEDKDFRFRAEAAVGSPAALHREAGTFIDL